MNCNSNWSEGQCTSPPCCDLNYMLNSCVWNSPSVTDCFGVCGGSAEVDICGVCDGDSSSCDDGCGVPNGSWSST